MVAVPILFGTIFVYESIGSFAGAYSYLKSQLGGRYEETNMSQRDTRGF